MSGSYFCLTDWLVVFRGYQYFNAGALFTLLAFCVAVAMVPLRAVFLQYVDQHWSGEMELVFANMSLAQAQTYVSASIAIFVSLSIVITVAMVVSLLLVGMIIKSDETSMQSFLWAHLSVAVRWDIFCLDDGGGVADCTLCDSFSDGCISWLRSRCVAPFC